MAGEGLPRKRAFGCLLRDMDDQPTQPTLTGNLRSRNSAPFARLVASGFRQAGQADRRHITDSSRLRHRDRSDVGRGLNAPYRASCPGFAVRLQVRRESQQDSWIAKGWRAWWTTWDLNPQPPHCERGALPIELVAQSHSQYSIGASVSARKALIPGRARSPADMVR